jgi:hypothetical protein
MSELHVRQIRAYLERTFRPLINLDDVAERPEDQQASVLLTRALAAFAIAYIAKVEPNDAAQAVTDGWEDNGVDAVYYDRTEKTLYIVQSKWRYDGSGSVDRGEIQKFIKGFRDLLNARWARFNEKISSRSTELDAILDDAATRIVLLVTYTGQEALSEHVSLDLAEVVNEINDPTELVSVHVFRQSDIYAAVAQGLDGAPINVDVALYDWGQAREPYTGFYGQVSASDVAEWFSVHQSRLFSPNIRMFLGLTEVNEIIVETLLHAPQHFWYFNNGITVLCRTIQKKPIGGNTRETGYFECHDLRVVNGAQTVGAISQANAKAPDSVARARVALRLIALENCPPDFDKSVTRYTNTQNRIDRRDFVALDLEQERIRGELQLEGVSYIFKSGETQLSAAIGFDLVEATVARACLQQDVGYAVQAKREIGKLWDDIDKAPYKVLFNPTVSGPGLWRAVQIMRQIDVSLQAVRAEAEGRERLLAVHGNRFIAHLVIARMPKGMVGDHRPLSDLEGAQIRVSARRTLQAVFKKINELYPDAYLGSLFKNAAKCQGLKDNVELDE